MKGLLGWETLLEDLSDSFFTPAQSQLTGHERLAWDNYYRYSSISSFARKLAQQHRTVECLQLGHTAEGRPLLALIIATDAIRMARAYTREVLSARRHQVKARTMQKNLQEYMTSDELSVETLIKRSEKGRKEKGHWVQGNIKEETDMAHSDVAQRQMTSLKFSRKKSKMRKPERLRQRQTLKVEEGSKRKLRKKVVEQKKADKWSLRKKRVMSKTQNGETRAKGRSGGKLRDKAKDISRSKLRKEAGRSKPVILIEAGAHAREWTSSAVATYLAQQLADTGKLLLKHVTFIIAPATNPDGYEYSITSDPLWRKNRRNVSNTGCVGVDLNRNWETAWVTGAGASDEPCSYLYRGPSAFSEVETRSLADLARTFRKRLKFFISLHSYGEYVLYPWSFTKNSTAKANRLKSMAKKITSRLNEKNTAHFTYGQSSHMMYLASGTADDYMYSLGVPFAYTIELPKDSFSLPPRDILPLAEQLWDTIVCTAGEIARSTHAKSFCMKRIVKIRGHGNQTVMAWVHKKVPLAQAHQLLRERYSARMASVRGAEV
ncbi:uncharacterized protein [Cherax quadricarinatus]